jgi:hypothetical protein
VKRQAGLSFGFARSQRMEYARSHERESAASSARHRAVCRFTRAAAARRRRNQERQVVEERAKSDADAKEEVEHRRDSEGEIRHHAAAFPDAKESDGEIIAESSHSDSVNPAAIYSQTDSKPGNAKAQTGNRVSAKR